MHISPIRKQTLDTIRKHKLISPHDSILVALSGGADSVCLTVLLYRLCRESKMFQDVTIAHLNHCLRGEESDRDAQFVRQMGVDLDIPVYVETVDVRELAKDRKLSLETAGRDARYSFFRRIAGAIGATKIATGHTADDQAETILMRMLRGAGFRGLGGIPYRQGEVIRPLLDVEKSLILSYVHEIGHPFCQDSSNLQTDCTRNKIRRELLPLLEKEYYSGLSRRLCRMGTIFRQIDFFLQDQTEQRAIKTCDLSQKGKIRLDLSHFFDYPAPVQIGLIRWCAEKLTGGAKDWTFDHYLDCLELITRGETGRERHFPGSVRVSLSYDQLIFFRSVHEVATLNQTLPIPGEIHIPTSALRIRAELISLDDPKLEAFPMDRSGATRYILADFDELKPRLTVRYRQPGDRIRLLGNGTKKVKDVLIDAKTPRHERDRIPIIFSGQDILWIVGYRRGSIALVSETNRQSRIVLIQAI
ncbi:MAG: tRNA lysidine(34) synthetase TilS [Candidatus Cloacimonetes bacterium 4572_55]|nr:MAG: tRNA lysidine(34) synthetase TilS [Candidatus Cloacimonetes bacterium 4572_55]